MRNYIWLSACLALLAAAVVAGCGGSSSSTGVTITSGSDTTAASTTTTESSGQATPEDVYNACLDAIEGTAAEQAAQQGCAQARDAFEQCTTQASNAPEGSARDAALKACQTAANKATAALKSAP
jgi:outer membrane PBP1 activator LpoA protein